MRTITLTVCLFLILAMLSLGGCDSSTVKSYLFRLQLANISGLFPSAGVFNTAVGAVDPSPIGPGESYEFTVTAGEGDLLSFATMFVQSNDLFYSPGADGIDLFPGGVPVDGDVTSQLELWDAGTEVNEEPGVGVNQAPRQTGPDTGVGEANDVLEISVIGDGFTYPETGEVIQTVITPVNIGIVTDFKVEILNVSTENTLVTSEGETAVPLAPGFWIVHKGDNPIFVPDQLDSDDGLEDLAEDGDPSVLLGSFQPDLGLTVPLAPGVLAIHTQPYPIFRDGLADYGEGLEALAEDGDPGALEAALQGKANVEHVAIFNTPSGASAPSPIGPGDSYIIDFTAAPGSYLSFATMFVPSNDLFIAPDDNGINLFPGGNPIDGDITLSLRLMDAGTEINEYPGYGPNQPMRQSGPDTGDDEDGVVVPIGTVNDGFVYPELIVLVQARIINLGEDD